ncbi:MAG: sodium-dependent transporter [Firmicutes bacterium]|nr:sodium-dependent transporter [Bacillota bacterium]
MARERFSSRLGFILISAGCAIGLGNVWRFPYIVGKYGGAAFVLIYLLFLLILGLPIMVMEFSVGRASRASAAQSFDRLEPKGSKWHLYKYGAMAGNYLLMMFYTSIGGWMVYYFVKMVSGGFEGLDTEGVSSVFSNMLGQPVVMAAYMIFVVAACFLICGAGLQKGVEKTTKIMMMLLLALMLVLAIRSVTLPNASEGLKFYLYPDFGKLVDYGLFETIFAAMGQAFFTLSLGIGSIAIFGSYIDKERSLTGEAICVTSLDTFVALIAGLIIFPSCFAYGVDPGEGPSLIFITLPNVFNAMSAGRLWGSLFFLFMVFAAASTIIAVFENIISFATDLTGCSRKKAMVGNAIAVMVLSMPCVLGFNVWSGFMPFGEGSGVLDLEDFIVSNNLLPLGSLIYLLFCTSRYGWGWDNFLEEADMGTGLKFPRWARIYVSYILPLIVLFIFVQGYIAKFS